MSENMPVNVEIDNGMGSVTFADDVIAIIYVGQHDLFP